MFDPMAVARKKSKAAEKRAAQADIKAWVMEFLPEEMKSDVATVSIQEFACGDPSCSPVDTGVTLMLKSGENLTQGIPKEMQEVTKTEIADAVSLMLEPPAEPKMPAMDPQTEEIFQNSLSNLFNDMQGLDLNQKMLFCDNLLEAVDNYQYALMNQMKQRAKASQQGNTILSAAQKNDLDALQKQIDGGVDASFANSVGQTALHVAVLWGNVEATQLLIEAGADVNKRNDLGKSTPLHTLAASPKPVEGRVVCARLLVENGADHLLKDERQKTPIEVAEEQSGRDQVYEYLASLDDNC